MKINIRGNTHLFPITNMEQMLVDFGLWPSSGILETRKQNVSETVSVSVLRWGAEDSYSVGSLRKS
jgi:hypothetical protein